MEEVIRQKTSYLILFWDSKDKFSAVEKEKLLKELIDKYQHKFNDILKIGKFDLNLNEVIYIYFYHKISFIFLNNLF